MTATATIQRLTVKEVLDACNQHGLHLVTGTYLTGRSCCVRGAVVIAFSPWVLDCPDRLLEALSTFDKARGWTEYYTAGVIRGFDHNDNDIGDLDLTEQHLQDLKLGYEDGQAVRKALLLVEDDDAS